MIRNRNPLPSHDDGFDSRRAEYSDADRWQPDDDEAPPLDTYGQDNAGQNYPGQRDPVRRVRKFIPESDDADFEEPPSPERRRRPVLRGIVSLVLLALIGSGGAALWFYYGPAFAAAGRAFSSAGASDVDKTTEAVSRLADEQRKLAQTVAGLQQLVQESFQKDAAARAQDTQRLSAQAEALRTDLDGLRTAVANATTRPPVAHAAKSAAVPPQKKDSARKPPPPLQAEAPPVSPAPEHESPSR